MEKHTEYLMILFGYFLAMKIIFYTSYYVFRNTDKESFKAINSVLNFLTSLTSLVFIIFNY